MNQQLFLDLKKFHGSIEEVARRANWQSQSVRKMLRDGKWQNDEVVAIAKIVLKERKKAMKRLLAEA
jgi:hypothetical protein